MHFQTRDYCQFKCVCKYEFKRLPFQLTTQTCSSLPPQEAFGEMPGIPPRKNRTDHGVASGSSVPHVTGYARTQVLPNNNTEKDAHRAKHADIGTRLQEWVCI